jgi:hypothetical protein
MKKLIVCLTAEEELEPLFDELKPIVGKEYSQMKLSYTLQGEYSFALAAESLYDLSELSEQTLERFEKAGFKQVSEYNKPGVGWSTIILHKDNHFVKFNVYQSVGSVEENKSRIIVSEIHVIPVTEELLHAQ